jgi:hypothetical protein
MVGVLTERQYATVKGAGPLVFGRLSPAAALLAGSLALEKGYEYRNDWPQRKVVLMQSSVRLMGSFCHSVARMTMIITPKSRV